jgi:hippurate hydrolase
LRVTIRGRGGHGSTPHNTVDPVVIAASTGRAGAVLAAITCIVHAEAAASGAPEPVIEPLNGFPLLRNDVDATGRIAAAFTEAFGVGFVHATPRKAGKEDFGLFGAAAAVPSVLWNFGGFDPALYPDGPARPQALLRPAWPPATRSSPGPG